MEELKKNKFLLYLLAATLVIFFGYFLFFRGGGSSAPAAAGIPDGSSDAGSSVLASLQELSSAQINTTFFTSAAWISLQDISAPIPTDNPGKANLFDPTDSQ